MRQSFQLRFFTGVGGVHVAGPPALVSLLVLTLFRLVPPPCAGQEGAQALRVSSITFEGNRFVDDSSLRAALRYSRAGSVYRPESLRIDVRHLEEYYRDQGYVRVTVGEISVERGSTDGANGVAIRIPISEGPRYVLTSLQVRNAESLSPETLLQMAPLRSGQPYSRRRLDEWKDKITESYLSMGYIRFNGKLTEEVDDLRHTVSAVLECTEGGVFRVRKISVVGDASVDVMEFRKKILVGEGGVYNPEMLTLTVQLLNQLAIYKPLSGSDVELTIDDEANAVDIIFKVSSLQPPSLLR